VCCERKPAVQVLNWWVVRVCEKKKAEQRMGCAQRAKELISFSKTFCTHSHINTQKQVLSPQQNILHTQSQKHTGTSLKSSAEYFAHTVTETHTNKSQVLSRTFCTHSHRNTQEQVLFPQQNILHTQNFSKWEFLKAHSHSITNIHRQVTSHAKSLHTHSPTYAPPHSPNTHIHTLTSPSPPHSPPNPHPSPRTQAHTRTHTNTYTYTQTCTQTHTHLAHTHTNSHTCVVVPCIAQVRCWVRPTARIIHTLFPSIHLHA
jgi:hypothetical protein